MFLTLCLSVQELRNTGTRAEDAASEKDDTLCFRGTRCCGRVHRRTRRKRAVVPRDESRSGRLLGEQETQLARRSTPEGRRLRMSALADEKPERKPAREDRKLGSGEPYSGWQRSPKRADPEEKTRTEAGLKRSRGPGQKSQRLLTLGSGAPGALRGARNPSGRPKQ